MRWSPNPLIIDPGMVALIARDLECIAQADGVLHDRERRLIAAFSSAAASTGPGQSAPITKDQQMLYTRSLVMVALSDGELCPEEYALVHQLTASRGIPRDLVEKVIEDLLIRFYGSVVQARQLRETLRTAAEDSGFDPTDAANLWPEPKP